LGTKEASLNLKYGGIVGKISSFSTIIHIRNGMKWNLFIQQGVSIILSLLIYAEPARFRIFGKENVSMCRILSWSSNASAQNSDHRPGLAAVRNMASFRPLFVILVIE